MSYLEQSALALVNRAQKENDEARKHLMRSKEMMDASDRYMKTGLVIGLVGFSLMLCATFLTWGYCT